MADPSPSMRRVSTSPRAVPRRAPALPDVVVLLSGGLDSAALLAHYRGRRRRVTALHVDYGQPARQSEWAAARRIAAHYKVPVARVVADVGLVVRDGEYAGRNALLVAVAGGRVAATPALVALGIHAGVPYYDCGASFVADMQRLLDGYFGGAVQLDAPFVDITKPEVCAWSRAHRVPLRLTYSCERRSRRPCGACPSCRDRRALGVR